MRKLIIFLFGFLNIYIPGQIPGKNIFTDAIFLPVGSNIQCIVTYRISYNQLVFVKKNSDFSANFRISAEVFDSTKKSIIREIKEENITVSSYELTAREDLFVQGFVELELSPISISIVSHYTDINSGYEQKLKEFEFDKNKFNSVQVFKPIVVKDNKQISEKDAVWDISNYQGDIPFSSDDISLVLVALDLTIKDLNVEIKNNDSTLFKEDIKKYFSGGLSIKNSNGLLKLVKDNNSNGSNIFVIRNINLKAYEGTIEVKIGLNKNSVTFENKVEWFLKPRTLQNEEYARKILTYIADEVDIRKIKNASTDKDYSAFFEFWKRFDPTPETAFNELMSEYYTRADYSIINYSVLGKTNGAETDRGKIHILYGKPDDVNRVYINSNDITEIWTYNSPKNKFVFRDKTGTGNFILESHQ